MREREEEREIDRERERERERTKQRESERTKQRESENCKILFLKFRFSFPQKKSKHTVSKKLSLTRSTDEFQSFGIFSKSLNLVSH